MAGNLVPAISTTNAIISGLIVPHTLHLLRKSYMALNLKNMHVHIKPAVPLSTVNLCPPNPSCGICRDIYTIQCDPGRVTLEELVLGDGVGKDKGTRRRDVSVYEDKRVLSGPDWDDNNERTLASLGGDARMFVTLVDEEGRGGCWVWRGVTFREWFLVWVQVVCARLVTGRGQTKSSDEGSGIDDIAKAAVYTTTLESSTPPAAPSQK
ncbi:hypothetical protein OG21DRAFT_1518465 [Imleria badia]|jgi:hypothetical protein|nr:hypothetical protein OG21DRAFT_1518465 [Imleria badia]